MKKAFSFSIALLASLFVGCAEQKDVDKEKSVKMLKESAKEAKREDRESLREELSKMDSAEYVEKYIQKVIKEGSNGHGYPGGEMQAELTDEETAKKISYFVVELTGRKSTHPDIAKKSQIFYTSNCGGCHGDDGKGLNGTYPDLTKEEYFGIKERREEILRMLK